MHEKAGEQGAAERQAVDDDVLVDRVSASAVRPQSVRVWDAQRGREVSVGAAAGCAFSELHAQLRGDHARQFEERHDGRRSLERRTIHATVDPQSHARVLRRQAVMTALTRSASAIVGILTSTTVSADSATTLLRVPPVMRPTLIVRPRAGSVSSVSRVTCQASS